MWASGFKSCVLSVPDPRTGAGMTTRERQDGKSHPERFLTGGIFIVDGVVDPSPACAKPEHCFGVGRSLRSLGMTSRERWGNKRHSLNS